MSLNATGISFAYLGQDELLTDLSLSVASGQSAAIMAPSGTGKSTLLAILGGLREPHSGTVEISAPAASTDNSPLIRPQVSWVFQAMYLLPRRTALHNVALALLTRGADRGEADEYAARCLERFDVAEFADRPVRKLSGGQAQRVGLARAAATQAHVILADEPTANLDRKNADQVIEVLFGGFSESALVVVTHDDYLASQADATYRMEAGKLVRSGSQIG